MNHLFEKAKKIKCLVCDMDGVLTDGMVCLDNAGNEFKSFYIQDGMGLVLLMLAGIQVAVITAAKNDLIEHRMRQLGIAHFFQGQMNKSTAFAELKSKFSLESEQFAYIGDDLPDLVLIKEVGFGVAVANAVPQVKKNALWVTEQKGGHGAVRAVCDFILTAQSLQEIALERYLRL